MAFAGVTFGNRYHESEVGNDEFFSRFLVAFLGDAPAQVEFFLGGQEIIA